MNSNDLANIYATTNLQPASLEFLEIIKNNDFNLYQRELNEKISIVNTSPDFQKKIGEHVLELGCTEKFALPEAPITGLAEALQNIYNLRKSTRKFSGEALGITELSRLLRLTYSVTGTLEFSMENRAIKHKRRNIASGGGVFPVELYYINIKTTEIPAGVYYYNVLKDRLELLNDFNSEADFEAFYKTIYPDMKLDMDYRLASGYMVASAYLNRASFKYGDKAIKFSFLDAGAITQCAYQACAVLGLGCCAIGGFLDRRMDALLELKSIQHISIIPIAIGKPIQ